MRTLRFFSALAAACALVLPSCTTHHGDFTVLSNKLMRLSEFELSKADRKKDVVGEDKVGVIVFIPTGGPINLEEAIDDCLRKGDGDVITDATIKHKFFWLFPLYAEGAWEVRGDVVKTRAN